MGIRPKMVALRLNLAIDGLPAWSRFGVNLESGQAREAVNRLVSGDRLELTGLHSHIGTFILAPESWRTSGGETGALCQ